MKTSNIIFLSFLIFLFGGITTLFIGSKIYNEDDGIRDFATIEKELPAFSVVVAEPGANFNLKNGEQNKMMQNYNKNTVPYFPSFIVRNDTLFVSAAEKLNYRKPHLIFETEIYCKNISGIVVKEGSSIQLNDLNTDSLNLKLDKARLNGSISKTSFVSLTARDSYMNFDNGENIEKIVLELDHTELYLPTQKDVSNVEGELKNNSRVHLSLNGNMNLKVDKSSYFSTYN